MGNSLMAVTQSLGGKVMTDARSVTRLQMDDVRFPACEERHVPWGVCVRLAKLMRVFICCAKKAKKVRQFASCLPCLS